MIMFFLNGKDSFSFLVLCAMGHEAGHLIAMRICGVKPLEITVGMLNLNIKYNKSITSYKKDFLISSSGVLVNIAFACLGFALGYHEFFMANLVLSIMNLLPINSLDGANIVLALKGMSGKNENGGYDRLYRKICAVSAVVVISILCEFNLSVVFSGVSILINNEICF